MPHPLTPRRDFIKTGLSVTLAAAALSPFGAVHAAPRGRGLRNGKLRVAKIACGGMGGADLKEVAGHPDVEIAFLCDTNGDVLAKAAEAFPKAGKTRDWREILDNHGEAIDAVVVSTPDHSHAPPSMAGLNLGKHVYTQKPLAHDAFENRMLAAAAAKQPKLATQMGTQRSATSERRLGLDLIAGGVLGKVKAIHAWTDRPAGWWPSGQPRPTGNDPVPADLNWDGFVGPAPMRPYVKDAYTPFRWRGTRDYGTGAIGDMACHILDIVFYGLDLGHPLTVRVDDAPDSTADQFPNKEVIRMKFAANAKTAADGCEMVWYDGGLFPPFASLGVPATLKPGGAKGSGPEGLDPLPNDGAAILVCEGGVYVQPIQWQDPYAFVDGKLRRFDDRKNDSHQATNHWHDWVDACLGRGQTRAPFQKAGKLCEALSVGAAASLFVGKDLAYDADNFRFTSGGQPVAGSEAALKVKPRQGYAVPGLAF
jgi:predicted dehydrogenase